MTLSLEEFFSFPITFFKIVGLTPFDQGKSLKQVRFLRILFWFSLIDLGAALIAQCAYFFRGMSQSGNFLQMISAAACIVFGAMGWEEMLMIWLNDSKFTSLIDFLKSEFPSTPTLQIELGIPKLYKETRTFMTSFAVCYLALIFAFNFTPLVANVFDYLTGQSSDWSLDLPYHMWFPFEPRESIFRYVLIYILESWAGFTAVVSCLSMNLFLGAIVTQLCLQLKIMKSQLENVHLQGIAKSSPEWTKDKGQLRAIVIKHGELIKCCQDLEEIFSLSIFVNQIASSLIICLVGFEVVVGVKLFEIIKFCLFLISSLLQTLTMSYFGQQIIDHSTAISSAVYHSNWLDANIPNKKTLLLILLRAQKPLQISGYKITTVSLRSFAKILSSSYSYFALLHTMYTKDE